MIDPSIPLWNKVRGRVLATAAVLSLLCGLSLAPRARTAAPPRSSPDILSTRALPQPPSTPHAEVGDKLTTGANERQRFKLPDGSVLYLNERSNLRVVSADKIDLLSGEVFVEVGSRAEGEALSAQKLGDAADVMASHPIALQLRNLQTLNEIAAEKNSTIVFPLPIDLLQGFLNLPSAPSGNGRDATAPTASPERVG